jgi:hypothetical protein
MKFPLFHSGMLESLVERHPIPYQIPFPDRVRLRNSIENAITSARNRFLHEASRVLHPRNMFFKTYAKHDDKVYQCLIDPSSKEKAGTEDTYDVYFRNDANLNGQGGSFEPTHRVILDDNIEYFARLQYGIDDESCELDGSVLDLFDVEMHEGNQGFYYTVEHNKRVHKFTAMVFIFKGKRFSASLYLS